MAKIENIVTSGTFSLDGETHNVDNNVYVVGDDQKVIVIDPAHEIDKVRETIGGRSVSVILLTHGHDDHISEVIKLRDMVDAPVLIHKDDQMLWNATHPDEQPDGYISDGDTFDIAGVTLTAIHTPGHSPGCVVFHAPELEGGVLFSGDTLFNGGPGATGRSYSDFDTIIESIKNKIFPLPEHTKVLTGHGDSTVIGEEKPHLDEWIKRGH